MTPYRFDTGDPKAKPTHCKWSGKVYCGACANQVGPLPEFILPPDADSDNLFTLSYDSAYYRSKTPSGRIQPVSKKPPEPVRSRKLNLTPYTLPPTPYTLNPKPVR